MTPNRFGNANPTYHQPTPEEIEKEAVDEFAQEIKSIFKDLRNATTAQSISGEVRIYEHSGNFSQYKVTIEIVG